MFLSECIFPTRTWCPRLGSTSIVIESRKPRKPFNRLVSVTVICQGSISGLNFRILGVSMSISISFNLSSFESGAGIVADASFV